MAFIADNRFKFKDGEQLYKVIETMAKVIEGLEARINALEQAYMEEKMLGKGEDPGKIES